MFGVLLIVPWMVPPDPVADRGGEHRVVLPVVRTGVGVQRVVGVHAEGRDVDAQPAVVRHRHDADQRHRVVLDENAGAGIVRDLRHEERGTENVGPRIGARHADAVPLVARRAERLREADPVPAKQVRVERAGCSVGDVDAVAAVARDEIVLDGGLRCAGVEEDAMAAVGDRTCTACVEADEVAPDRVALCGLRGIRRARADAVGAVPGDHVAIGWKRGGRSAVREVGVADDPAEAVRSDLDGRSRGTVAGRRRAALVRAEVVALDAQQAGIGSADGGAAEVANDEPANRRLRRCAGSAHLRAEDQTVTCACPAAGERDLQHGIRPGDQRVRARPGLRIAVDRDLRRNGRQRRCRRDHVWAGARNGEDDGVRRARRAVARVRVGVEDRLAQ